jgi:hypothetical protein
MGFKLLEVNEVLKVSMYKKKKQEESGWIVGVYSFD